MPEMVSHKRKVKASLLAPALASVALVLHGCGGSDDRGPARVLISKEDCSEKCVHDHMYGRWQSMSHGHLCLDSATNQVYCDCSSSPDAPPSGCDAHGAASLLDAGVVAAGRDSTVLARDEGPSGGDALFTQPVLDGAVMVDVSATSQTQVRYTQTDTVNTFCDTDGLKKMHGQSATADLDDSVVVRDLESKILGDVARELESNNVDKMAKEIFTFYVCARWVPDAVFWDLARQELAAQVAGDVLGGGNLDEAIADMYRRYRFVPMLCSKNLEVFAEKDEQDHTYFRKFKQETLKMANWLEQADRSPVNKALADVDNTFCGDEPMVSCNKDKAFDGLRRFFGMDTEADLVSQLANRFKGFTANQEAGFQDSYNNWKQTFPYHSFIGKPKGWDAQSSDSPRAKQRFVVCFGKRVASELHRRPNGAHILTDQNNIGCHGWYEAAVAAKQLKRMVELWKPPTCQLAEMTYVMKKEIMAKFQEMNERLFDSLPSQLNDEMEAEARSEQDFQWEKYLPKPFAQNELADGARVFVDDMRVGAARELCLAKSEDRWIPKRSNPDICRDDRIKTDVYGTVKIQDGRLHVMWDGRKDSFEVATSDVEILPMGWKQRKSWHAHVRDLVAGVNKVSDKALALFNSLFAKKQQNLADLMSGSVSKWVVCPVKAGVADDELDAQLGVEDEAFKDFQMEAYKSWTGFKKEIPGEKCELSPGELLANGAGFEGVRGCEINELHANHVEVYTKNDETMEQEQFICPLRPPLSSSEQLEILHEKKGMCLLHMTEVQRQQYSWHYQGEFPARRQNDRKNNVPTPEFELVKLIKVPGGDITTEVDYGRYCSLQELKANPRFCDLPEVHNDYSTAEAFAELLADSVQAVALQVAGGGTQAVAPTGVSASALSESVSRYQERLKDPSSTDKLKEKAKNTAIWVGENTWDALRGTGRLLRSTARHLKNKALDDLRGKARISNVLQDMHFGNEKMGQLLHAMSFQRSIGKSNTSSNSKERFQRYVMTHPCPSFDPARSFALKQKWADVALRLTKEAHFAHLWRPQGSRVLDQTTISVQLRGEVARYRLPRSKASDSVTHAPSVSMLWDQSENTVPPPQCREQGDACLPSALCSWKRGLLSSSCVARSWASSLAAGKWWVVSEDPALQGLVAPAVSTGTFDLDGSHLFGLKMELFCAPKKAFGAQGPPQGAGGGSLEACLRAGMLSNARLRSKEPWKLYFPDEVIVVARFSEISESKYFAVGDAHVEDQAALSRDATNEMGAFAHLLQDGLPVGYKSGSSNKFAGMRSGKGFPQATLAEVVLAPEDVLEALTLIDNSYGR